MTIQEQINADLKQAMLQKDEATKSLLRVVIGEFNRVDKVVPNDKAISILKKMIENAMSINNINETIILEKYVPKQLTEDQLKTVIVQILKDEGITSLKDMGKVMSILKKDFAGQYDGKLASELIKKELL